MREKAYVSDIIGDCYKSWKPGKFYLLQAGTGTGKSTFILNELLPYAAKENKKILYLVNRTMLMKQLMDEVERKDDEEIKSITIWTYQYLEQMIKNKINYFINDYISKNIVHPWYFELEFQAKQPFPNENSKETSYYNNFRFSRECALYHEVFNVVSPWQFDYIICDEAHYFTHDSIFNTNTSIAYKAILGKTRNIRLLHNQFYSIAYREKIPSDIPECIFMSATMRDFELKLEEDLYHLNLELFRQSQNLGKAQNQPLSSSDMQREKNNAKFLMVELPSVDADYSYVRVHKLSNLNDIPDLVCKTNEKWIIFINDTSKGKRLVKAINDHDYNKEKKALVATNLETDMLDDEVSEDGRKNGRASFIDAKYRDEEDIEAIRRSIKENHSFDCQVLVSTSVLDNGVSIDDRNIKNIIILTDTEDDFIQMLGRRRVGKDETIDLYISPRKRLDFSSRIDREIDPHIELYKKIISEGWTQQMLADKLLKPDYHEKLCHFVYSCWRTFILNELSYYRFGRMKKFYRNICDGMKEDENAFLKTQFAWLGKTEKEADECINEYDQKTMPSLKESMIKIIEEYLGDNDSSRFEEMRKELYGVKKDKGPLKKIIQDTLTGKGLDENVKTQVAKRLSGPHFNALCEYLNLPYNCDNLCISRIEK